MITAESMLSKRPVLRFTAALFFLLKLFSSHVYCIPKKVTITSKLFDYDALTVNWSWGQGTYMCVYLHNSTKSGPQL